MSRKKQRHHFHRRDNPAARHPSSKPSHPSGPGQGSHGQNRPPQNRPQQNRPQPNKPQPGKPGPETFLEGKLQLRGRFGFVLSEDPVVSDVYVDGPSLRLALDGDRVMARVTSRGELRRSGEIIRVLERARTSIVGTYKRLRDNDVVVMDIGGDPVRLLDKKGLSPKEGQIVVVKITRWPTADAAPAGELLEILGLRDDPGVDMQVLTRKHDLPGKFPAEVLNEAKSFGDSVPDAALNGRTTFFHLPVFTIDGKDAKDFDDAVSLEVKPNGGYRLGVHIADVAHYVKEGNPLDEEALKRGTSVYLVDRVIPMLPHELSDNLCSLRPNVVRLTLTCVMDLDSQARVVSSQLMESAIRSARRFTYEDVEDILTDKGTAGASGEIVESVRRMGKLARQLREIRFKRGSLDFDFPEPEAILDELGRPMDIRRRTRLESHRLIEEFMLLANETVAQNMKAWPFLYRVHPRPDPEKLTKLMETLRILGVKVPSGFAEAKSSALQEALDAVEDLPIKATIHSLLLRSMKQAVYSPDNVGHFGLASACYTHFTSPIRRYPDLCVHRLIREKLRDQLNHDRQVHWKRALPGVCTRSSQRERLAQEAERESMDVKRVQLMQKRVGEKFDGNIVGVTNFGFFVQLKEVFVEGLVRVANLNDYFIFDEVRACLRGKRTGQTFRMGMDVKVLLAAANVEKRQLDFELVEDKPSARPNQSHPRRR